MGSYQRRRGGPDRSRAMWIGAALLIVGAGVAWWFWLRPGSGEVAPVERDPARDTAAARAAPAERPADLPALDASDELVRRLAAGLSSRPRLAEWLATEDLVRRFVGAVVRIAAGRSPREPLAFMAPEGEFAVRGEGGGQGGAAGGVTVDTTVIAPASYRRYDPAAATFASLDTRGTAELYRRLRPLFRDAYEELGFREPPFDAMLARAVDMLLAVPVPGEPVEVVPDGAEGWAYADPRLEGLAPAQKQLLRMGPDNVRRVQAKLREMEAALELPEPARETP